MSTAPYYLGMHPLAKLAMRLVSAAAVSLAACTARPLSTLPLPDTTSGTAPAATAPSTTRYPPDPDTLTIIHDADDGRRTMLLDPRSYPLYDDNSQLHGVEPEITIERVDDMGYDIVYEFDNTSGRVATLGCLGVGILTLGDEFSFLDQVRNKGFSTFRRSDYSVQAHTYPGPLYSPLAVLTNDEFAIGVSLQYDLLGDRHGVRIAITKPGGRFAGGPGGSGYAVQFFLSDAPGTNPGLNQRVYSQARLNPGESRTYRVSVRAMALDRPVSSGGPQEWLETVEPYRQHFARLYGGTSYTRDPRPTNAVTIANRSVQSDSNPRGFRASASRPDRAGWSSWVARLRANDGYSRTMLIAPSGLSHNRNLNFPSRFMTGLLDGGPMQTAFDPVRGLPSLDAPGQEIALWWGRAAETTPAWGVGPNEPLNLLDSRSMALARAEFDLALQTKTKTIGLDAYTESRMPAWQRYAWILEMRLRDPSMKIIVEPRCSDVLHSIAGTFTIGWQNASGTQHERFYKINAPFFLADYLLPGHESWARFTPSRISREPGAIISAAQSQRDAEHFARLGWVPSMQTEFALQNPAAAVADPSWIVTVPERLKTPAHRQMNPPPLTPPQADDSPPPPPPDDVNPTSTRPLTLPNGRVIWIPVAEE